MTEPVVPQDRGGAGVSPYGTWASPITLDLVLAGARDPHEARLDGDDLYFVESRPDEGGRDVVMRRTPDGAVSDVTPAGLDVRTRVHEYGGGAWAVRDGLVVFSTFPDGHLHRQRPGSAPTLVLADDTRRFADIEPDPARGRVLAVCEHHAAAGTATPEAAAATATDADAASADPSAAGTATPDAGDPVNTLVAIDLESGALTTLAGGPDFVSDPRLSPAGDRLCWLTWHRPNMPWDGTDLWVAEVLADGALGDRVHVAGGTEESVAVPTWAPDGSLVLASDRSGWWNLYRWTPGATALVALAPQPAEFAGPQWVFGLRTVAVDADGTVVAVVRSGGRDSLIALAPDGSSRRVDVPATDLADLTVHDGTAAVVAYDPSTPTRVLLVDLLTGGVQEAYRAAGPDLDPGYLSVPRHVEFPTVGDRTAFAYYYAPTNRDAVALDGELPPLVVFTHGGPTSNTDARFDLGYQFWTSRGFAVVDVDYGGSTGYGREYRNRLRGQWGVVDLDDCTRAAQWLAEQGLADPARLLIRGGSAGGYTTLCALAFRDAFAAGASYFGVGDLEALARDTHKFESRYLDLLVAPYPARLDVYHSRSPVHHAEGIRAPLLLLQGTEDRVVPQAQADDMVAALVRNGTPYAYVLFPGEGHGFRQSQNKRRALAAELSFYAQVLGFVPADELEPLAVVGLPDQT